jgi:hypothetical protein
MSYEVVGMERRTEVLKKSLGLSDRLAEFITQHYCPKTMKSGISGTFYRILASVMDVIVEGLGTEQALNRHKVLDVVKGTLIGEEVEEREYRMYVPTLGDIVAVLNFYYFSFVSTCLSEEYKLKFKAEEEKVKKELEKKTKKKRREG